MGRVRLGGLFFFRNTVGSDTYRGVAQCRGPIDAIENYFIGQREVVVDQITGECTSPPWATTTQSYLFIKNKIGDGTETAWTELITAFPTLWTADHRVRGIAQLLVQFVSPGISSSRFLRLYGSTGVREQIETVVRAELVYDPRDVTQDIADPTTYKWTKNGVLNALHMLRSFPSIEDADIDFEDIKLEADKADVLVSTRSGLQPRATASGVWAAEGKTRNDIMLSMLNSIGADIFDTESGLITIKLLDDDPENELTFNDNHVSSIRYKYGPDSVERPNVCRVKYYSPERNYELSELLLVQDDGSTPLAWSLYQDEIDAVGEQPFDLELPFCDSAAQAQRIARRLFSIARADTGVATFNMAGLAAWGARVVTFNYADIPSLDGNKALIGTPRVDDSEGQVEIPFIVNPDLPTWIPATDEALPPEDIPEIQFESELEQPNPPSQTGLVKYIGGGYEVRLRAAGVTGAVGMEANYRLQVGGLDGPWLSMVEDGVRFAYQPVSNLTGEQVDFRVRMFNASDEVSYFSDIVTEGAIGIDNTKPAAPTVGTVESDPDIIRVTTPSQARIVALEFDNPSGSLHQRVNTRPFEEQSITPNRYRLLGCVRSYE